MIIFNIGGTVIKEKDRYLSFDYWERFDRLKYIYENSQYVSKNPKMGWIPDEFLNAYAGGAYIKGVNPILINSDTPPLGRYLIGFSALVFGNENLIILLCGFLTLILMYVLSNQIFLNTTLALLPPALFSFEKIFKNQLIYVPLLDIIQLPFLLFAFIIFNKALNSTDKRQLVFLVLANISIGCFMATKFFITGATIIGSMFLLVLLKRKWNLFIKSLLISPISILTLLLSYIRVFNFNYSLREFLGIQKYVYVYHQSQLILSFTVWPLILLNKWYVWYGDKPVISDAQWMITWPIIQIFTLCTIILYIFKKIQHRKEIEVVMVWSILYILFLSIGTATTRYFVIYIPILYIISLYGIVGIGKKYIFKKYENRD